MCDCEMPEFFDRSIVTARREHRCCECRQLIRAGDKYYRNSGKWDGDMSTYKTHVECEDFRTYLQSTDNYCDCIPFGGINEEVEQGDDDLQFAWWLVKTVHRLAA